MNKKELIKHFEDMPYVSISQMGKKSFINMIEKLDEPQKVTIPQFVADWIEYCKNTNVTMTRAILVGDVDFYNYANQKDLSRLIDFFSDGKNQEIFARAWLDGYTAEKEYLVKIKANNQYIMNNPDENAIFFYSSEAYSSLTRKELEDVGFGWVFDCEGIEIKEVEK